MSQELRVITPKYQATLEPPVIGAALVEASISYDGLPVAIWSTAEDVRKFFGRSDDGCHPNVHVNGVVEALLTRHNSAGKVIQKTPIFRFPVCFPHIQSLPSGAFLLVGSRCRWHAAEKRADHNAFIYDFEGKLLRSGAVGDGVTDVQALSDGTFWTGYFYEGIIGNNGWHAPFDPDGADKETREPIGTCGLIRWDNNLESVWRYPTAEELTPAFGEELARRAYIDDHRALHCTDEVTTICPNYDFAIMSIAGNQVTRIVETHGALRDILGLAVSGSHILAYCVERGGGDHYFVLSDTTNGYQEIEKCHIDCPEEVYGPWWLASCRDSKIHWIDDFGVWFTVDINDVWPDE
ncbi:MULTISPECIES: hypothetical protein [Actinotignum]|uniref:hypothetical protein n=1 Tax=Actinotignum TaxID=1653174 RepID=UPI002551BD60|nr:MULTISPECIES: hypothetical protein [Actinotignum]MDK7270895.1 hypothetical protein [Actinotignum schaalii]MDY5143808.1 hypothetical protein [Actinotignum timonense]